MTRDTAILNLRAWRDRADAEHVAEGTAWYPTVSRMISEWAHESGHTRETIAGVIAAYSQNSSWPANVTMARRAIFGDDHELRGLSNVVAECEDILYRNVDPAVAIGAHGVTGRKRVAFYRAILGRHAAVPCDRWHLDAAGVDRGKVTDALVAEVTAATRAIARERGEAASTCQAIIWCAIRAHAQETAERGKYMTPSNAEVTA